MAWIRRVRTASGATAAQISESVGGRRRMQRARALLENPGQGELDLGVEPLTVKTSLVHGPEGGVLLTQDSAEDQPQTVPAPRVVSTSSRVLYDALAAVFTHPGFEALEDAASGSW